jgi:hypothetical protein
MATGRVFINRRNQRKPYQSGEWSWPWRCRPYGVPMKREGTQILQQTDGDRTPVTQSTSLAWTRNPAVAARLERYVESYCTPERHTAF